MIPQYGFAIVYCYRVLRTLNRSLEPLNPSQIDGKTQINAGKLTVALDTLVRNGYVTWTPAVNRYLKGCYKITLAGKTFLQQLESLIVGDDQRSAS